MPLDPLYIQPGELRNRVTVLSPSSTQDAFGQSSSTWVPILNTRASIQAITQRETTESGNLVSQVSHIIKIRYPGSGIRVVSGQRILGDERQYEIQAVDDVLNRHRVLKLLCVVIDEASTNG